MTSNKYIIPRLPLPYDLETKEVLKQLNKANKKLAELKGVAQTIPNEQILISSLTLQEAKDSSAVENIVTTQDDLYRAGLELGNIVGAATKEVLFYREAISNGFAMIRNKNIRRFGIQLNRTPMKRTPMRFQRRIMIFRKKMTHRNTWKLLRMKLPMRWPNRNRRKNHT